MQRTRFTRAGLLAIRQQAWGIEVEERSPADRGFIEEGDAAIVEIRGPLINRAEGFLALFCDDYDSIGRRVRAALESPAKRVILRINSPGGDASGCFELARELREMARAAGKELIAFAEDMCASAAFALASGADRIIASPTSYTGSIGVFEAVVDWTAQNAAMGLRVVVVSSGESKTDRNPDVAITEEAIGRIRAQVDQFAGLFFDLVAELRGGKAEDYRRLDGAVFLGASALGVGLVDAVGAWKDVIAGEPGASGETDPMGTKASKGYDDAIAALRKCAENDDDEGKKAKRMLQAELEPDGDEEKAKKAKAEEEKKKDDEAKAKAAEEEKKREEEEAKAKAAGASADTLALTRRVHELEAKDAAREEAQARADLLAKRPDFSPAVRATLAKLPLDQVREAVEKWEKIPGTPLSASAAATTPGGTRGAGQAGDPTNAVPQEEVDLIDRKMGLKVQGAGIKHEGRNLELGMLTPEAAQSRLAELQKGN